MDDGYPQIHTYIPLLIWTVELKRLIRLYTPPFWICDQMFPMRRQYI